ncbi:MULTISPECIES: hypothetical protein [unclassified Mesorhizobium]|uniref:hypothetical protein n=1 Tax=unclassified Mesorhizobium TaxID=325217 RepID=UPI000FCBBFC1|nr:MULTISPECIES: hypothetical protein [unclassified Mesorhizobium]RUZ87558.1 hypothetical protein EN947_09955 [Mesorhizobium sp. M7A.F.Ca.US.003.02.2.1]RVA54799.1 hypothetical protein EN933_09630 [Mesorhizobium sp. M7A.F.Ca.US.001.01.1.1]MBZ9889172.1 hypothetical protein [Mesorhizobium sp. BR1-1-3]RUY96310.1 hypothetical protein EN974_19775 [Mesorhizobium sp. M7A.F.Ca.CA.001.12.2.1]RUZ19778.1 hypothetical protein EN949_24695 [Mesorhizobium sp. M7A.F.Ca.US.007.01.2.1]
MKKMREFFNTAIVILLIAIAVVLLFLAPRGFQLGPPDPLISSRASGLMRGVDSIVQTPLTKTMV